MASYDKSNIFAKILRGEIPNNTVYEDEYALAFHDINPLRKLHVLGSKGGLVINMGSL